MAPPNSTIAIRAESDGIEGGIGAWDIILYIILGAVALLISVVILVALGAMCAELVRCCCLKRKKTTTTTETPSTELQDLDSVTAPTTTTTTAPTNVWGSDTTENPYPTPPSSPPHSRLSSPSPPSPALPPLTSRLDDPPAYTPTTSMGGYKPTSHW